MVDKFKPLSSFVEGSTDASREPSPAFDEALYWKDPTAGDVKFNLTPLTITFPNTEIGTDSNLVPITLFNTGLVDFTISEMSIYGDYFIANPFTGVVAAGTSLTINIGFRPNSSTELTGTLYIATSLPADQQKQMFATFSGWGYGTSVTTLPLDIYKHEVLTTLNVDTYAFDEAGLALNLLPEQNIVMGMSPYGILTEGIDYTITGGGGFQFTFMPEANELFHIIAFPSMYQQNTRELMDVYTTQAKELVGEAVYMRKQKINIVSGTLVYTLDADGQPLQAMPARAIILSSPTMPHWIEIDDYTVGTDGSITFLADPGVTGVVQLVTLPTVFNSDAQALIDQYLAQIAPQVVIIEQSVVDAAASEAAALVSETNAAASEAAALASQGAAGTSATNAAASEANADADRIAAEAAKVAAEAAATAASADAGTTSADAAAAAASAAAALVSEGNAATSETNAGTSETNALASENAAAASAAAANVQLIPVTASRSFAESDIGNILLMDTSLGPITMTIDANATTPLSQGVIGMIRIDATNDVFIAASIGVTANAVANGTATVTLLLNAEVSLLSYVTDNWSVVGNIGDFA